jgi:mono/diheme cytochrome c family protein
MMSSSSLLIIPIAALCLAQQQTTVWDAPPEAKKLKNEVSFREEKIDGIAMIYREKCVSCHGENGKSNVPASTTLVIEPADLTKAKALDKMKDGELFWKISKGRPPMPGFEAVLSETDRWQMVNYVRYLAKVYEYRYLGKPTPAR